MERKTISKDEVTELLIEQRSEKLGRHLAYYSVMIIYIIPIILTVKDAENGAIYFAILLFGKVLFELIYLMFLWRNKWFEYLYIKRYSAYNLGVTFFVIIAPFSYTVSRYLIQNDIKIEFLIYSGIASLIEISIYSTMQLLYTKKQGN